MSRAHRIALLGGDGFGPEVIEAGMAVLKSAAASFDFELDATELGWNSERYLAEGSMMPDDWFETSVDSTRSTSVRSELPKCPTTRRCGACCSRSGSGSTST